jgi:hypothetical protein
VERCDRPLLLDERRDDLWAEDRPDRVEERCPPELRALEELRLFAILTPLTSDAGQCSGVGAGERAEGSESTMLMMNLRAEQGFTGFKGAHTARAPQVFTF